LLQAMCKITSIVKLLPVPELVAWQNWMHSVISKL